MLIQSIVQSDITISKCTTSSKIGGVLYHYFDKVQTSRHPFTLSFDVGASINLDDFAIEINKALHDYYISNKHNIVISSSVETIKDNLLKTHVFERSHLANLLKRAEFWHLRTNSNGEILLIANMADDLPFALALPLENQNRMYFVCKESYEEYEVFMLDHDEALLDVGTRDIELIHPYSVLRAKILELSEYKNVVKKLCDSIYNIRD